MLRSASWRNRSPLGAGHTRRLGGITRFYTHDPAFNAPPSDHFLARSYRPCRFEIHEDERREAWIEWVQFVLKPSAWNRDNLISQDINIVSAWNTGRAKAEQLLSKFKKYDGNTLISTH